MTSDEFDGAAALFVPALERKDRQLAEATARVAERDAEINLVTTLLVIKRAHYKRQYKRAEKAERALRDVTESYSLEQAVATALAALDAAPPLARTIDDGGEK